MAQKGKREISDKSLKKALITQTSWDAHSFALIMYGYNISFQQWELILTEAEDKEIDVELCWNPETLMVSRPVAQT
ncbi:hypothetical protein HOG21_07410 [bacterium]|nr:hypothetical protein [bacterium]